MCSRISWCMNRSEFSKRFSDLVSDTNNSLNNTCKRILKARYINIVNNLEVSSKRASFWYLAFSYITTVGSIIVPALISVQDKTFDTNSTDSDRAQHQNNIYWASWGVSLTVTLSNALLKLLSLDKIHITRKLRSSHLKSEGWLYLELAGDYTRFRTHQRAFVYFCNKIEKIKSEQIREEYTFDNIIREPFNNEIRSRGRRRNNYGSPTSPTTPTDIPFHQDYPPSPTRTSYYEEPPGPSHVRFDDVSHVRSYDPGESITLSSRSLDETILAPVPVRVPTPVEEMESMRRVSIYPDYENRDDNYPFGMDLGEDAGTQTEPQTEPQTRGEFNIVSHI